jgi:hypothetical protein
MRMTSNHIHLSAADLTAFFSNSTRLRRSSVLVATESLPGICRNFIPPG